MKISFEWGIVDHGNGTVTVIERLVGSDHKNEYGPIPGQVAESFVRARRDFIHRVVTTRAGAIKIFEPTHRQH
jgi:hypothetical protein